MPQGIVNVQHTSQNLGKLIVGVLFLIVGAVVLLVEHTDMGAILVGAFFALVGLAFIALAAVQTKKDSNTNRYGTEKYGIVTALTPTGNTVAGHPVMVASVLLIDDNGQTTTCKKNVSFEPDFKFGDYVRVKHNGDNIIILGRTEKDDVPI